MGSEFMLQQIVESSIVAGVVAIIAMLLAFLITRLFKIKNAFKHKHFPYFMGITMLFIFLGIKALPNLLQKDAVNNKKVEKICILDENNIEHCLDEQKRIPLDCIFNNDDSQKDWCKYLENKSKQFRPAK